jgi:hypothetical protein
VFGEHRPPPPWRWRTAEGTIPTPFALCCPASYPLLCLFLHCLCSSDVNPSHLPSQVVKFAKAASCTTACLTRELPKAKLDCPDACHARNPRDSINHFTLLSASDDDERPPRHKRSNKKGKQSAKRKKQKHLGSSGSPRTNPRHPKKNAAKDRNKSPVRAHCRSRRSPEPTDPREVHVLGPDDT